MVTRSKLLVDRRFNVEPPLGCRYAGREFRATVCIKKEVQYGKA
jgi:hypothetical protein